jgi:SAM-dependent methyltransferase
MRFNADILIRYMSNAPLALAFERSLECQIYSRKAFARPILDLGCGDGTFANVLFAERIDAGIDPDSRELKRARELGSYVELIRCVGTAVPKRNGSYRTVLSNSVIEHIPDLRSALAEVHRLLAQGGRFYFTAPSDQFARYTIVSQIADAVGLPRVAARYRGFYNEFWKHFHSYPLENWKELAREAGFGIDESFTFDPKWVCLLNDFLVLFSLPCFLTKRILNRWTILPSLRKLLLYPVYLAAKRVLRGADRTDKGGLVFMALVKGESR